MRYRTPYVFGAVGAVVIVIVIAASLDPNGKAPIVLGAILPILLVFGILAYQWKWAGSQHVPPLEKKAAATEAAARDAGQIEDYWTLFEVMAIKPIDEKAVEKAQQGVMGLVKANIGLAALIMIFPIAAALMIITGKVPEIGNGAFIVVIPFILAPLALLWARYQMARAGDAGGSMLEPLGLEMTGMPTVGIGPSTTTGSGMGATTSGSSVMEGARHGRKVRIELGARQVTTVAAKVPLFKIERSGDRLSPDSGAPAAVVDLIEGMGRSGHWRKFRSATGTADGIVVERKPDAESGWLWDLWLAEALAERCAR